MTERGPLLPVYEYKCIEGHIIEISHPMNSAPEVFCAECSGIMTKQLGLSGAIFKGSGWGKN